MFQTGIFSLLAIISLAIYFASLIQIVLTKPNDVSHILRDYMVGRLDGALYARIGNLP